MPRIYAVARDNGVASRDIMDICVELGIEVKTHASSISEDDARRVVQALKKRSARATTPAATASAAPRTTPSRTAAPLRREDYVPSSGITSKVPDLTELVGSAGPPAAKKPSAAPARVKPRPKVQITTPVKQPVVARKPPPPKQEPKAQKPQMRLSPEALRGMMKDHLTAPPTAPTAPGPAAKQAARPKPRPAIEAKPKEPKAPEDKRQPAEPPRAVPTHRPGAVAGREERQKRRGRRALERRRAQRQAQAIGNGFDDEEQDRAPRSSGIRQRMQAASRTVTARPEHVTLESPVSVRTLSQATGIRANELLRKLVELNIMANINATLDDEVVQMLAMEFGVEVELKKEPDLDEETLLESAPDRPEDLQPRPPVVTLLGHVDHGKTSLLDAIRQTNVVSDEAGGITQHIGAYQVSVQGRNVTFLDTPGHQAFTKMRARGAHVTDIVVLVVAADDGVMPQTEEAISHAKAAQVPIVVAINKIDLPNADPERVMQQLSRYELMPAAWGGDTEFVSTSATTGQGIDQLLETLVLVAELRELKANPNKPAVGTCLESSLCGDRGVNATLLIQGGTLARADLILCGQACGRVKAMFDDRGRPLARAGPSTPVTVYGLDSPPEAGERFCVLDDLDKARRIAERRRNQQRMRELNGRPRMTLENLFKRMTEEQVKELPLIIRADVRGSLEAIAKELEGLQHEEVAIRVLQSSVGGITEGDVLLADASDAVIIGFNVAPDERARTLAEEKGVQIRRYEVIYQLTDDLRKSLEGLLEPEQREVELGRALVQQVFKLSRIGNVAGCRVLRGTIERNAKVRLIRDSRVIYPPPGANFTAGIQSLRRHKDDVREVREGFECGLKIAGYEDLKPGDIIEVYKIEQVRRTL